MWVGIAFLVLLFAVALFQGTQGLFSGLIMAVLSICCAAASVGCYEWIAVHWLAPYWKPDYAFAIALAATFGVPLIILRLVADNLVRRACLLPSWVDRIGGGICGLITAFTVVGMMAFALGNLPFGGSILGFERIVRTPPESERSNPDVTLPEEGEKEHGLFLNPDRFVVGMATYLSAGLFSGKEQLAPGNPDIVQAVGWANAVPATVSRFAPPQSISVVETRPVSFVYKYVPPPPRSNELPRYEALGPEDGSEFHAVRVSLRPEARDSRKSHLFTLRQFRLVGRIDGEGPYQQCYPIALQEENPTGSVNRHIRYKIARGRDWPIVDDLFLPRDESPNEVEVVFELPKGFVADFLEYKQSARTRISLGAGGAAAEAAPTERAPADASSAEPENREPAESRRRRRPRRPRRNNNANETVPDSGRGGNVRGLTTQAGRSTFSEDLPLRMTAYQGARDVQIRRGRLANGHLIGFVEEQANGSDRPVEKFNIPRDRRLLQLNTGRLQSRSGPGRALDFAARTVQNYFVEDSSGNRYQVIGKYAIADVNGRSVIEVQYFPEQAGSIGGLGAFERIRETELQGDYAYVLLFLVEPGATITSFSTGGSASRRDDLSGESLVAPD